MEKTMAVIDQNTNQVVNMIIGDENSPTEEGTYLAAVPENMFCNQGFLWNGSQFLNEEGVVVYIDPTIEF